MWRSMGENQEERRIPLGVRDLPSHELFARTPPAELYHYTTLQGAYGIITSKQLWLTKIQHLNDVSELRHAIELFRETVKNWRGTITTDERSFIDRVAHQLGSFTETNICVASFCEDGDLLSQWRGYGAGATGIALGFSGAYLKTLSNRGFLNCWKCIYERRDHQIIIGELVDMALCCFRMREDLPSDAAKEKFADNIVGYFNTTFLRVAPVLKDPNFREEQEWRIITTPQKSTHDNFDVVFAGSRLLPIFRLEFPTKKEDEPDVLGAIRIGPTANADLTSNALFTLLTKHGYTGCSIQPSLIPYRAS